MRQRVCCTQILLERHTAHRSGDEHVAAGVDVLAVGDGGRQRVDDERDPLKRDAIAQRLEQRRSVRLDAVGEGVEPGGGSQPRWQAGG